VTLSDHDDGLRVSDAEREQTVAALRDHVAAGRLTFDEFNERVGEAYVARTGAQLRRLLADLPSTPAAVPAPPPPNEDRLRPRRRMHWATSRFLFINGLCTAIWAASGAGYFWPIWVIIPTGAICFLRLSGSNRLQTRTDHLAQRHADKAERIRLRHEHRVERIRHRQDHGPPVQRGADSRARRVVMSVLFVDIVGSTQRAAALGDTAWREVVDEYEQGAGRQIRHRGGETLFTRGDEIVAGFTSPAGAVEAAQAIRTHANSLGLQVRAGVHAGEVDKRGNQANGIAMHIGRRVCETAEPDQVLVSSTVRDLLSGSEIHFSSAGDHELKGLDGTWHLFEPTT
jgi:class 3 adenylate cyclase